MPARLLIVEDNPTNLELMSYLLGAFGYPHCVARDGLEGVETALRERPDLIICDIQLPKMDGYEVVKTLKRDPAFKDVPVVAVTALAMVGDRDKVLAKGFNGYIPKPIQPETFVTLVEKFLDPLQRSQPERRQPAVPEHRRDSVRDSSRGTILVVDDVEANRNLGRALLESCGFTVTTASSVAEAFKASLSNSPDMILSDFHLPDGTGLDLFGLLRAQTAQGVPFLLISSSVPNLEERTSAERLGIKFMLRPIDSARLLSEIESAVAGDAARR